MNWELVTEKIRSSLGSPIGLFGLPTGVDPDYAANVATSVMRGEVDAYIATIPRVPTNKNDVIIAAGGMALVGLFMFGVYKMMVFEETVTKACECKK
jgi:hypothetical protein